MSVRKNQSLLCIIHPTSSHSALQSTHTLQPAYLPTISDGHKRVLLLQFTVSVGITPIMKRFTSFLCIRPAVMENENCVKIGQRSNEDALQINSRCASATEKVVESFKESACPTAVRNQKETDDTSLCAVRDNLALLSSRLNGYPAGESVRSSSPTKSLGDKGVALARALTANNESFSKVSPPKIRMLTQFMDLNRLVSHSNPRFHGIGL